MDFSFLETALFWSGVLVAYIIPKFSPYIDRLFSLVWSLLSDQFPRALRTFFRNRRANKLRLIRKKRWRLAYINYEIARSNAWFIVFLGTIGVYIILLATSPLNSVFKTGVFPGLILTFPIYVIEMIWLFYDNKTKQLLRYNSRIRITGRSS